jgi:hypothetical protein
VNDHQRLLHLFIRLLSECLKQFFVCHFFAFIRLELSLVVLDLLAKVELSLSHVHRFVSLPELVFFCECFGRRWRLFECVFCLAVHQVLEKTPVAEVMRQHATIVKGTIKDNKLRSCLVEL